MLACRESVALNAFSQATIVTSPRASGRAASPSAMSGATSGSVRAPTAVVTTSASAMACTTRSRSVLLLSARNP